MSLVPFDSLPDDARLWVFAATRASDDSGAALLSDSMASFIEEWTAHRRDLVAGFEWRDERFLLVGVDESAAGASGCSIDALTGHLRRLGAGLDLDLLDFAPVWFRDTAGFIRTVSRAEFTELASRGEVSASTTVFDLTVSRVGEARNGHLERAAGTTWHRNLLTTD